MPKGRWITDRMVEKSSTSADVKFNTCSPRSVSRNAVPLFDDSLVISPAAHKSAHFTVAYSDKFGKSEHAARRAVKARCVHRALCFM